MTPEAFQALYAQRAAALPEAIRRGTRNVLLAVERQATKNLTGTGEAGAYPIPVRSRIENGKRTPGGNLRRSMGVRQESDVVGYVFNRARYAHAVHTSGFHAYGNPHAPFYKGRPFLDDAADQVDTGLIFRRGVARALGLPA